MKCVCVRACVCVSVKTGTRFIKVETFLFERLRISHFFCFLTGDANVNVLPVRRKKWITLTQMIASLSSKGKLT